MSYNNQYYGYGSGGYDDDSPQYRSDGTVKPRGRGRGSSWNDGSARGGRGKPYNNARFESGPPPSNDRFRDGMGTQNEWEAPRANHGLSRGGYQNDQQQPRGGQNRRNMNRSNYRGGNSNGPGFENGRQQYPVNEWEAPRPPRNGPSQDGGYQQRGGRGMNQNGWNDAKPRGRGNRGNNQNRGRGRGNYNDRNNGDVRRNQEGFQSENFNKWESDYVSKGSGFGSQENRPSGAEAPFTKSANQSGGFKALEARESAHENPGITFPFAAARQGFSQDGNRETGVGRRESDGVSEGRAGSEIESDLDDGSLVGEEVDSDVNEEGSVASLEAGVKRTTLSDKPSSTAMSFGGSSHANEQSNSNRSGEQASSSAPFPAPKEFGHAVMVAPKKAPADRRGKRIERLLANIFTLEVSHKIVYRYDVCIRLKREAGKKDIDLTKGARDDAAVTERHELCVAALRRALEMYRILNEGNAIAHDGSAILFSSEDLEAALKPENSTLTMSVTDLPPGVRAHIRSADVSSIEIEIFPCRESASQFDIADFENAQNNRDMAHLDRSWKQFHEMLTNQDAIANGRFTLYGAGKLFSRDARRRAIGFGHELVEGGDKGIKFIEGRKKSGVVAALVLDAKVGQFFKSQNLLTSVRELLCGMGQRGVAANGRFPFDAVNNNKMNNTWVEVNKYVKGLRLNYVNGSSNSSFVAIGISRIPVGKLTEVGISGEPQPILTRFSDQNPADLLHDWPAVVFRGFNENREMRAIHYPMELLMVAPHQRVSLQKQLADPEKAAKPHDRYNQIANIMNALNLDAGGSRNAYLNAFGIRVADRPYKVEAIRRKAPVLLYSRNTKVETDEYKSNWKMDRSTQYVQAGCADLIVFAYTCDVKVAKDCMISIERMMKSRGMRVGQCKLAPVDPKNWMNALSQVFTDLRATAKQKKCMVVFIDYRDNKSHGWLKLLERRELIITQQISKEVAEKLFKQPMSCSNVVNKVNCKLTGLNHSVVPDDYGKNRWISKGQTLIMGYDVAHPGRADRDELMNKKPPQNPSVVGFSFNGAPNPESFIGDFHFQTPRVEQVAAEVLNVRMKWMLKLFVKNRGTWPESIFVVRDGISEGQYRMAIDHELAALREACEEYGNLNGRVGWSPKFLMVVVTKRHSVRMFKEGRNGIENPLPCTVVDTDIVRNDMTEFLMQPHRVIQGTGKSPTYQILIDDLDLTSDEIQATMLALAFNHQIVESPISLPEPVYQADEWAKRGNEMWKAFSEKFNFPMCKDKCGFSSPPIDFDAMTARLGYWNTILEQSRVNA